ncbi:hypothetical protein B0T24DRAFT_722388 [Lasiosphaeria ovina]|uniref:Uncharacterized protein n=1 Tax=Lasiosphaeria ovina TaxID=92902 RepID=A0AAE0N4U7_9PEZI|nr:hypothetical protein B0T24DRAFT_722388 [Lasiosphaeria ovina]
MPGRKQEADNLTTLFSLKLGYTVERYEIPSTPSLAHNAETHTASPDLTLNIQKQIMALVENTPTAPRSLTIIHYGGHGDEDQLEGRRNGKSVWGAYPARAAAKKRVIPDNVELLAACAMDIETLYPALSLEVRVRGELSNAVLNELLIWLKDKAPIEVSRVSVTEQIDRVRNAEAHVNTGPQEQRGRRPWARMATLPEVDRKEVEAEWKRFTITTCTITAWFKSHDGPADQLDERQVSSLDAVIGSLDEDTGRLERVIEKVILSHPGMQAREAVLKELRNGSLARFDKDLLLRQKILEPAPDPSSEMTLELGVPIVTTRSTGSTSNQLVRANLAGHGAVLVEYKVLDMTQPPAAQNENKARIERLARVLKATGPVPQAYRTPECLGYETRRRPPPAHYHGKAGDPHLPTLGKRFKPASPSGVGRSRI